MKISNLYDYSFLSYMSYKEKEKSKTYFSYTFGFYIGFSQV